MSQSFKPIEMINPAKSAWYYLKVFIYRAGNLAEVPALLLLWLFIFHRAPLIGGFTREEMITYIIAGNIITLAAGYFLHRLIRHEIFRDDSKLLVYKPIRYFFHIIYKGIGKNFLPLILAAVFQLGILYFFIDSFIINFEMAYIGIIIIMAILAFITEFLLLYFLNLFNFWAVASPDLWRIFMRLKNVLAGAYFPLSFLPGVLINISLVFPFAYLFFAPMELYLKKMSISSGFRGICIQIIWIVILYLLIKMVWSKKIKTLNYDC